MSRHVSLNAQRCAVGTLSGSVQWLLGECRAGQVKDTSEVTHASAVSPIVGAGRSYESKAEELLKLVCQVYDSYDSRREETVNADTSSIIQDDSNTLSVKRASSRGETAAPATTPSQVIALLRSSGIETYEFIKQLQEAQFHHDPFVLYRLGECYEKGEGVQQDNERAIELYKRAGSLGSPYALLNRGLSYKNEGNMEEAKRLFEEAADMGNAQAMVELGLCLWSEGTNESDSEAFKWFKQASDCSENEALFYCGLCHEEGKGTQQNRNKAIDCFRKASDKNPKAMTNLAVYYERGICIPQDIEKARHLRESASERGDPDSQFNQAVFLEKNQHYPEAFKLYIEAWKRGHTDACVNLAFLYEKGICGPKNESRAVELLQEAAEKNNVQALFNLAIWYERGHIVEKDEEKAIELYKKCVEHKDVRAMVNLAMILENKKCEEDKQRAFQLYLDASNCGNIIAMRQLSHCYENGVGCEKDEEKAFYYYQKASGAGQVDAGLITS